MTTPIEVTLKDVMGSDLTVVNAARVSFNKESDWDNDFVDGEGGLKEFNGLKVSDKDAKLIHYLAKHGHWTPFGHPQLSFHIKAPIFVARQLGKHQVGLVWNEVSRRYVDDEPEFYVPDKWRARSENVKQGSEGSPSRYFDNDIYMDLCRRVVDEYSYMLEMGVCPEQARMVLPQSTMTEWWWTGSLAAFARVCKQRLNPHSQYETKFVAWQISDIALEHFPVSWRSLLG